MSLETALLWVGFGAIVLTALSFDLFVLQRKARAVGVREALVWSAGWIGLGLAFAGVIFAVRGSDSGYDYLTGYLLEKSLSVDNIFVFLLIFQYFGVPDYLRPKALRWGIIGAFGLRAVLIAGGAALITAFTWMKFVFGFILLLAAFRLAVREGADSVDPSRNPVLRLLRRIIPMTEQFEGERFLTRADGVLAVTPLVAVLVVIETTDLVFALDSIPAVLAITDDMLIVYTSNVFAILGLRALYFALAGVLHYFAYLRYALVTILAFVAVKLMISEAYEVSTEVSLGVIAGLLLLTAVVSVLAPPPHPTKEEQAR